MPCLPFLSDIVKKRLSQLVGQFQNLTDRRSPQPVEMDAAADDSRTAKPYGKTLGQAPAEFVILMARQGDRRQRGGDLPIYLTGIGHGRGSCVWAITAYHDGISAVAAVQSLQDDLFSLNHSLRREYLHLTLPPRHS